jgi:bifunctional DNase/RNase
VGDGEELVTVEVIGVRQHLVDDEIVVLLLDPAAELFIPILIGPAEASAIATAQAGVVPRRPMTHDLLCDVIAAVGESLTQVEITSLEHGVFHAALVLGSGARVDSRASDAVALAVRVGCPVLCSAEVVAVSRPGDTRGLRVGGGARDELGMTMSHLEVERETRRRNTPERRAGPRR